MKKIILFFILFGALVGCTKEDVVTVSDCSVGLDNYYGVDSSIVIRFLPDDNCSKIQFSIGMGITVSDFEEGYVVVETIDISNDDQCEYVLEEPESDCEYTVIAKPYDKEGNAGAYSFLKIDTSTPDFYIENTYLTESTAGFVVSCASAYPDIRYYLGTASDEQAFISGEIESEYVENIMEHTGLNWFSLESGKEYVLFVEATDRYGNLHYKTMPFKTYSSSGECPSAEYEIVSTDAYKTEYKIIPNGKSSRVGAIAFPKGLHDGVFYGVGNGRGNLVGVFESWISIDWIKVSEGRVPLVFDVVNDTFTLDQDTDLYIICFDDDSEISGVYKYNLVTSPYVEDAGLAEVSVTVSNVTSSGATYRFVPNEHTMAFMYETVEADWFDEFTESAEYYDTYLHERLFKEGGYFSYGKDEVYYVESSAQKSFRYYAAACPMNVNGPQKGWCPLTLQEYVTLDE